MYLFTVLPGSFLPTDHRPFIQTKGHHNGLNRTAIGQQSHYNDEQGPGRHCSDPCTSNEEVIEIARVAKSVEEKLGCAQDMEWAIDKDLPFPSNIFWLQTRPAKVQASKPSSVTDQIVNMIAKRL